MASIEFEHSIGFNTISHGIHCHPNGQSYIYSTGGNIMIGDLTDPHVQRFLRKHDDKVSSISVSPSGGLVASGQQGRNSNIYIWDFEKETIIFTFEEHDKSVDALAFSHDDRILASVGGDQKLILWDMSNGMIIAQNIKLPADTCCVAFGGFVKDVKKRDTDHYLLCTAGKEGMMLWDLDPYSGDLVSIVLKGDARATITRSITDLSFSHGAEYVYGATTSGDFVVASVRATRILTNTPACKKGLNCVEAVTDGLIIGGGDFTVKLFDNELRCIKETSFDAPICSMSMSPDKSEVILSTKKGTIYRLNTTTMQSITISESHTDAITSVAFAPTGSEKVATASMDGTIKVWDLTEYMVVSTSYPLKTQAVGTYPTCVGMTDVVLSGWNDGRVLAHDIWSGEHLWSIDNAHVDGVSALAVSHNNRFILTGGPHGEVRLWELRSRDLISHLKEHTAVVNGIALFRDDAFAVSVSRDRCILKWDLRIERRVTCNMQRMGGVSGVAISRDEKHVITVGQERTLSYWTAEEEGATHRAILNAQDEEADEGRCVGVSNDGNFIVTGGTEGVIRLWSYESGAQCANQLGHSGTINGLSFSGDDRQVVSGGSDGCIFIWNVFA
jgi:cilia- and flagella-associated protein 52